MSAVWIVSQLPVISKPFYDQGMQSSILRSETDVARRETQIDRMDSWLEGLQWKVWGQASSWRVVNFPACSKHYTSFRKDVNVTDYAEQKMGIK